MNKLPHAYGAERSGSAERFGLNKLTLTDSRSRDLMGSISWTIHRLTAVRFPEMWDRKYYYIDFTILQELVMDWIIDPYTGMQESQRILEGWEWTRLDKKLEKIWLGHNAEKAVQKALLVNKVPKN